MSSCYQLFATNIFFVTLVAVLVFSDTHQLLSNVSGKFNVLQSYSYNNFLQPLQPQGVPGLSAVTAPVLFQNEEQMLYISSDSSDRFVYQIGINSWYRPFNHINSNFKIDRSRVVTLCQTLIVFDPSTNDPWMFNKKQFSWKKLTVVLPLPLSSFNKTREGYSVVALRQTTTSCSCKESVVLFGGIAKEAYLETYYNDLWELHCLQNEETYEWRSLEVDKNSKTPLRRSHHAAISAKDKSLMYITGGSGTYDPFFDILLHVDEQREHVCEFSMDTREWRSFKGNPPVNCGFIAFGANLGERFFFTCCSKSLVAFDMQFKTWLKEDEEILSRQHSDDSAFPRDLFSDGAVVGNSLLLISDDNKMAKLSSYHWYLSLYWDLRKIRKPLYPEMALPAESNNTTVVHCSDAATGVTFTFRQEAKASISSVKTTVGVFNMTEMKWFIIEGIAGVPIPFLQGHTVTFIIDFLVIFGGIKIYPEPRVFNNKIFFFKNNRMLHLNLEGPSPRIYHSAVSINSTAVLIFGGLTVNGTKLALLNDMWIINFFNMSKFICTGIKFELDGTSWPSGRFGHSSVQVNSKILMYGGIIGEGEDIRKENCSDQFWEFDIIKQKWTNLLTSTKPSGSCLPHLAPLGGDVIVFANRFQKVNLVTKSLVVDIQFPERSSSNLIWIYSMSLCHWIQLNGVAALPNSFFTVWPVGEYRNSVGFLGDDFYLANLSCPEGMHSPDFPKQFCLSCPVGSYSDQAGMIVCSECPEGTTTPKNGSSSLQECYVCGNEISCWLGDCEVVLPVEKFSSRQLWRCNCYIGFTYDNEGRCTVPSLWLVGLTIMTTAIPIVVAVFAFLRLKRKFKLEENENFSGSQDVLTKELVQHKIPIIQREYGERNNSSSWDYDVFCCFSGGGSKAFCEEVYKMLDKKKVKVFFDKMTIQGGRNIVKALFDSLSRSKYVAVFLTDEMINCDHPEAEATVALCVHSQFDRLLPIFHSLSPERCGELSRDCFLPNSTQKLYQGISQIAGKDISCLHSDEKEKACRIVSDYIYGIVKGRQKQHEKGPLPGCFNIALACAVVSVICAFGYGYLTSQV
eukprot:m.153328 g.153328  ORF g.153328 m.153328 type:complete len:1076 (+) comp38620_c0_seq9:220-3447(+)